MRIFYTEVPIKYSRFQISLMTFLLIFLASGSAAQFRGCQCGAIRAMHSDTQSHITLETTESARNIIDAMRSQTQQNSRYLDRQVKAAERIADASSQNNAQLERSRIRAASESGRFDPNPDYCLVLDTAITPVLPVELIATSASSLVQNASAWSRGKVAPVVANGLQMAAFLAREREEIKAVAGSLDATTDWAYMLERPTLDFSTETKQRAVSRLISNTVDPFPSKPLSEEDLRTPEGLSEAVRRRATEARNQTAFSAIELSLNLVSPSIPATPFRNIAARSRYDGEIPDIISELQALDIRINAYYAPDAETLEMRHTKTERALLQDLIDLLALNTRMAHLRLQQESRSAILQAALLGLLTDGTTTNLNLQ